MKTSTRALRRNALAAAVALMLTGAAQAQLSTATIKGQISGAAATPTGLAVTAVNKANGNTYRTTTRSDGSYVLTGLAPGEYEIRVAGASPSQAVTVAVGETAAVDLSVGGQVVTIIGRSQRQDVRGSEVGTNVSRRMIEAMPQSTRNFLSSADFAPGVAFSSDASGNTKIQAGSQNFDHVNVFIDGVGQKNNILRGGLSGQDSSRGNPFPQSAIAEFKVLSQNYKAEYEQVSSAAVTAITKSGTNTHAGEAYIDRTGTSWRTKSVFEKEREAAGVLLPSSTKQEYGFSVGGPIVRDQLHFFFAYDGKSIDDSRQITGNNFGSLPASAGIVGTLRGYRGSQIDNFKEHLFFGKVDAQIGNDQRLSASVRVRREDDRTPESRDMSAPGNDVQRSNDETRMDLKHEWTLGALLSEARLGYEDYTWNPHSSATTPFVKYKVSTATPQLLANSGDVIFAGGSPNAQNRAQKGSFLSEDLTYTGLAGHVVKGGVKIKNIKYDLSGTAFGVDTVETLVDTTSGLPYYNNGLCTGTNVVNGGLNSDQCRISRAIPGAAAKFSNTQFGIYLQDDWALSKQLELNAGVRWDVESNMLNNDYVTPADRVTALRALDVPRWGITPPAGQTYAQSLAKGGVNINDYIATGNRKQFYGAVAPRVGFSYDIKGDKATVVYGGFGRAYDRAMANYALDELQRQLTTGDQFMIRNDYKTPFSDQFSAGLRQALGQWNGEVGLNYTHAKNQFNWVPGDRAPDGGWGPKANSIDPNWGAGPQGYGMLILGDFVTQQKTTQVFVRADKPYTKASGWAAGVTYTYSDAKTTHRDWNDDIFNWSYGKPGESGDFHTSRLVEKHRIVATGLADGLLPWGLALGGKATVGSGLPYRITACPQSWDQCHSYLGKPDWTKQFDLSLSKAIKVPGGEFSLRVDVLNLFNTVNWTGYDDWGGGPGNPQNWTGGDNATLGKRTGVGLPMRTYKLSMRYAF